ncbi:hypothetical protein BDQ12DRAFT_655730 [Crucibulum laeve]|uniref:Zn(2)-C6 fungal-type domain-containing protein n=1 Tax=Crucibulum laeve TaxID=68775 RepID=A0A5C3LTE6_9AGAR|nr:hypothetical protein BDQ12DRAFT_655730 [Crucibulum laeve]
MSPQPSGNNSNLQRGGACVNCRRRKMRCDGVHPICGQCDHAGRPDDCEYVVGQERSRTQILEENISRLEARIQELQNPHQANPSITLHQPYSHGQPSGRGSRNIAPSSDLSSTSSQDPPVNVAQQLLDHFLPFASEFGFFLNASRFQASALTQKPQGHPSRPAPALMTTAYLWGIHLSRDPSLLAHEQTYLTRALQQTSTALSGNHPNKVIHGLQAEVLLAYYFFANGRFLEGKYHVTAAVSISVSAGLNKIRSRNPTSAVASISPARDSVEEGERINACWTVFTLDKCWAAALDTPPNLIDPTDKLDAQIDTPWPMEMSEYEQGRFPTNVRTSQTIQKFLSGTQTADVGMSSKAILAKSALLWERVSDLARSWYPGMSQHHFASFSSAFAAVDSVIDRLKSSLPPLSQVMRTVNNPETLRTLAVAYSMINGSILRLHNILAQGSESSTRKRMSAAQGVVDVVTSIQSRSLVHLNPIIGTIWVDASQILINELSNMRTLRASYSMAHPTEAENSLTHGFERGLTAIEAFSRSCTLTNYQVRKIQETYAAL